MCMNISLATFLCLYRVSCSLKAFRRAADSFAITDRSSAAVLQARTALMRSLQSVRMTYDNILGKAELDNLLI